MVLGNPPYNGFAGVAVDEERELSEAYRTTNRVRRPEGQGLNDLYVRFFRMAERRIAEKTGQGVVCFISNYSWLDGLSFTGMRERYLEAFDAVRIDCLNGDKYKTGKVAPDGTPDPSIFSTEGDPVGIQVGTAIATLVRKAEHAPSGGGRVPAFVGAVEAARTCWKPRRREPDAAFTGTHRACLAAWVTVRTDGMASKRRLVRVAVRCSDLFPDKFPRSSYQSRQFLPGRHRPCTGSKARIADYFDPGLQP